MLPRGQSAVCAATTPVCVHAPKQNICCRSDGQMRQLRVATLLHAQRACSTASCAAALLICSGSIPPRCARSHAVLCPAGVFSSFKGTQHSERLRLTFEEVQTVSCLVSAAMPHKSVMLQDELRRRPVQLLADAVDARMGLHSPIAHHADFPC